MYKVGDKVCLRFNNYAMGTVVEVDTNDNTYKVKLQDSAGYAWSNEAGLLVPQEPKCQCGLKYARDGGKHSRYCSANEDEPIIYKGGK